MSTEFWQEIFGKRPREDQEVCGVGTGRGC
jgi:hypothetical protein